MSEQPQHHSVENPSPQDHNDQKTLTTQNAADYWHSNLRLLAKLLTVWFVVSFGCGILLVDWLDQFTFFGFKLGFWFAQQGSIYTFVALVFWYSHQMNKLGKKYGMEE